MDEGWIVRIHSKGRKTRFHPLHSSLPVEAKEFHGLRVTKRFLLDGNMAITQDHWMDENRTHDNATWSGYTFLKLKDASGDHNDPSDDGSYERIDP